MKSRNFPAPDEIAVLLGQLKKSNRLDGARSPRSRQIRVKLRSLGHRGGLRTGKTL